MHYGELFSYFVTLKRKSNIFKTSIALFFLFAFVHALGKNIACGIEHLPFFADTHHANDDHHDRNHHHDGNHHNSRHDHHDSANSPQHEDHHDGRGKPDADDSCCTKLSSILFASLSKPLVHKADINKSFETASLSQGIIKFTQVYIRKADYFSWKAAPPKIPDIRVFIQSFLI